ncbi:hypothetical protein [Leptolyngbya sp. 7M]|uniref:hypothetical protein n=1 Tax=Leptolyngbya sp. 7M TaxID=2812896 RepID=UPI001B8CA106|nr:hypothetical protein [Leptolyngbya sp. 7M]QYO64634.1 hypothetical protein JVX88_34270 [Leptolyngbya sp. 7M]
MLFHTVLAMGGFHHHFASLPPRLLIFGPLPAFLFVIAFLSFDRETVARLPLTILTLIHVIRIPVEFVLHSLYYEGGIPREMTFEGWNFDIATGITAPIAYLLAFGKEGVNKPLLIGWNLAGLFLLAVIVITAVFAFPFPFQKQRPLWRVDQTCPATGSAPALLTLGCRILQASSQPR